MMTECGIARSAGTSTTQTSTNIFGGDGITRNHANDLLPLAGGRWDSGSIAGVFALLGGLSGFGSAVNFAARSVRLLSA
jgi:hypothetical protein